MQNLEDKIQETYSDISTAHNFAVEDYQSCRKLALKKGENDEEEVAILKDYNKIVSDKLNLVVETIKQRTELLKVIERMNKSVISKDEDESKSDNGVVISEAELEQLRNLHSSNNINFK